ncbi:MAG: FAD:protein FMN transferase [Patescibacteria group bacterium]
MELSNVSISSSGEYLRKWRVGEDEFRHIVFPTTVPAGEECASVTVVDPSGAVSDAFATALFAA